MSYVVFHNYTVVLDGTFVPLKYFLNSSPVNVSFLIKSSVIFSMSGLCFLISFSVRPSASVMNFLICLSISPATSSE